MRDIEDFLFLTVILTSRNEILFCISFVIVNYVLPREQFTKNLEYKYSGGLNKIEML